MNEFGERARYGSEEMRQVFSPYNLQLNQRRMWVALARQQAKSGLVSKAAVTSMEKNIEKIDVDRIDELERNTKHDVVAAKQHFEEVAPQAKGKVHLGATSMDIQDNAEVLAQKQAIGIIKTRLVNLLDVLRQKIVEHKHTVITGYTHGQAAEPTTLGYRFSSYAQDLMESLSQVERLEQSLKGKGLKGAVGSRASYAQALGSVDKARRIEEQAMREVGLQSHDITTQTYPRIQDRDMTSTLERIGSTLARMNYDYLFAGSTPFNEYREGFAEGQKGSSAMPFKRNQTKVENIIGMSHVISGFHHMVESSAKFGALERTIHDSVVRRIAIPQIFLAADEALSRSIHVLNTTEVNKPVIERNLREYGVFGLSEPVLSELSKKMDRSDAYDWLQQHSNAASAVVAQGGKNDFVTRIMGDTRITELIGMQKLRQMLSIENLKHHVGDAPKRAEQTAGKIRKQLRPYKKLVGKVAKIKI